jgi:hypothetical protein
MKNILLFIAASIAFVSCDVIDEPYLENPVIPGDTTTPVIIPDIPRRVLLEEFTGYRCANCPQAADLMKQLKGDNDPGRVELLTIHWGVFANPTGIYSNEVDLTNEAAKQIHDLLGVNSYPRIAVSRKVVDGQFTISPGKMEQSMNELLFNGEVGDEGTTDNLADMDVWTEATLNGATISIESNVFYVQDSDPNHHIVHYIVEDSIVGSQLDDRKKPDTHVPDYIHTNTLRDAVNGFFGEPVSETVIPRGDTISFSHTYNVTEFSWQPDQLMILTLITDDSGGEVLQVYKTKVVE